LSIKSFVISFVRNTLLFVLGNTIECVWQIDQQTSRPRSTRPIGAS